MINRTLVLFHSTLVLVLVSLLIFQTFSPIFNPTVVNAQTTQRISNVSDNRSEYAGSTIPKHKKLEITFSVDTNAGNPYLPYDPSPPPGINPTVSADRGVTVQAVFTSPDGKSYMQPAFYYQKFQEDSTGATTGEWLYAENNFSWKARFSPTQSGNWSYRLEMTDSQGSYQTNQTSFTVSENSSKGFVKVSDKDKRYFEFDDNSYFPGLGYNSKIEFVSPRDNETEFQQMGQNNVHLIRSWITQMSLYGSTWGAWFSPNPADGTQEPDTSLVHPQDSRFSTYPNITPPNAVAGSDVYLWLNQDETTASNGLKYNFSPCRILGWNRPSAPVKPQTEYRIRARYVEQGITGPNVSGKPYGFVVKDSKNKWLWNSNKNEFCYQSGQGKVLAATYAPGTGENWSNYPDPQNPGWRILEGTFTTDAGQYLINDLYLAIENAKVVAPNISAGHVFIDYVWIEEKIGSSYGPNLINKPWMAHHKYVNQRDSYAFDKIVAQAEANGVYIKGVMLDKNDYIFQSIDSNGQMVPSKTDDNFYGDFRNETKVRWLQKAWWRYMQARWGYSPNIHSWELLNEGPSGPRDGRHWVLADEFGKYMHCGVFGVNAGSDCTYDHPNDHMVTTSFWAGGYPFHLWHNTDGFYPDIDYADIHEYADEGEIGYEDAALFNYQMGQDRQPPIPFIRGEIGWKFPGVNIFADNVSNGLWLHNLIWGSINQGAVMELLWTGPPTDKQIVKPGSHDHRSIFKKYYQFIHNVPLNNGGYSGVDATVTNQNLRVWGQKNTQLNRAHVWIQNKNNTWKKIAEGITPNVESGQVTISGFSANTNLPVQWYDTREGVFSEPETKNTDSSGNLVIAINNLSDDVALRIGTYSSDPPSTTIFPDWNGDQQVTVDDYSFLKQNFNKPTTNTADNGDGIINLFDLNILVKNLN